MPRRIKVTVEGAESFGERLARLRKAAGYSQRDLAAEIGISQRMVAYYEGETDQPPTVLLPAISRALGVSADELLAIKPVRKKKHSSTRLARRLQQMEKLPARERRQIVQIIDAFLERARFKKTA